MDELRRALFDTSGRLGRFDWLVWSFGLSLVANMLAVGVESPARLLLLAAFYPQLCLDAKRLHDLGVSAWWQAPVRLLSVIAFLAGGFEPMGRWIDANVPSEPVLWNLMLLLVVGGGWLAYSLTLLFGPGSEGANRFGSRRGAPRPGPLVLSETETPRP